MRIKEQRPGQGQVYIRQRQALNDEVRDRFIAIEILSLGNDSTSLRGHCFDRHDMACLLLDGTAGQDMANPRMAQGSFSLVVSLETDTATIGKNWTSKPATQKQVLKP